MKALGMIEFQSMVSAITAADAITKAAKVELMKFEKTGGGYVTVLIKGDVAQVKAGIEAGIEAALHNHRNCKIIASLNDDIWKFL